MWIRCPHCGEKTQLGNPSQELAASHSESVAAARKSSKRLIWIIVGIIALCAIAAVLFYLRQEAQRRIQELSPEFNQLKSPPASRPAAPAPKPKSEPDLWNGLKPGAVTIEKPSKGRLIYAVGTIRNDSDKQRYGVKVTLDVLDSNGEKIGSALDQTQFIDAHKEWNFRALVTSSKAKTAKVTSITED